MSSEQTRDERELDLKKAELTTLKTNLVERELALLTLQQQLSWFRAEYLRTVGKRYAALDDLDARMNVSRAARRPDDTAAREAARRAWNRADAAAAQANDPALLEPRPPFDPPAELQTLYRALARKLHPDLAATDEECALRRPWMRKLDAAYKAQDGAALKALNAEWETGPENLRAPEADGELARAWLFGELTTGDYTHRIRIGNERAELKRQRNGATERIKIIDAGIRDLKADDLCKLYRWRNRWTQGCWTLRDDTPAASSTSRQTRPQASGNLLEQMATRLDAQIAAAKREDSGEPHLQVPASEDAHDLFARGLADLETWVEVQFTKEQWDKLRPKLDNIFRAVARELKPGQDLLREFIRVVKDALVKAAKLPSEIAKAAVKRWNRETKGGRTLNVEVAETDTDNTGPKEPAGGPGAAGGGDADGAVGEGGPQGVSPAGEGGDRPAGGKKRSDAAGADGAGVEGGQSGDDGDGSRPVYETRLESEAERSVVGLPPQAQHGTDDVAEDCFELGRLCERDGNRKDAVTWYRRAADKEHAGAQYQLGLMYLHGHGRPQVPVVAAMWFRRAADHGHADAQHHLGLMYRDGQGVPRDRDDAAAWLRLAADQGHFEAQFILDQEARQWPVSDS